MKDQKSNSPMTGASILWECLEREGVKHVFGYPLHKHFKKALYGVL